MEINLKLEQDEMEGVDEKEWDWTFASNIPILNNWYAIWYCGNLI